MQRVDHVTWGESVSFSFLTYLDSQVCSWPLKEMKHSHPITSNAYKVVMSLKTMIAGAY